MTTTATDLRAQVVRFLEAGDHGGDYDVDGIVEAIRDQHGLVNLDSIDAEDFNAILAEHDKTA